jgi:hypothetical protein
MACVAVVIVVGCATASAQGSNGHVRLSATLESELAIATATDELQKAEIVFTPEIGFDLTPSTNLIAIVRIRSDIGDRAEPGQPAERNRAALSKRWFVGDDSDIELRELYVDTEIGSTFLRVGKQQVVWGQADGLKVLDVLNPQSFREFILDDFEDSRIPLWTVNAEIPIGDTTLQLLWIPENTYDDIPEANAPFTFTSPRLVPQTASDVPVNLTPIQRPDDFFADSDVAAKLSAFVGGWDLSLNYVYHYSDQPVIRREISAAGVTVHRDYQRTHLVGGTFSTVFDDFALRGELGFSGDRFFITSDTNDADGVVDSGELSYVLGLDYQGWRDWFISAQFFQSIVLDTAPGLVRDDTDTTVTLLVRRDFINDSLQVEALLIHSANEGDGVLQASLDYEWHTNIRLRIGADVFYGTARGLFGQFTEKDRVSVGVEFGF